MKAKKWIIACACFAGSAFATRDLQFDVVIRDFSVNHPDFENYSEVYAEGYGDAILDYGMVGYGTDWYSRWPYHSSCGNYISKVGEKIGVDGKPMEVNTLLPEYLRDVSTASALKYGECADKSRGYSNGQNSSLEPVKTASCASEGAWAVEVYYTPGMVGPYLGFNPGWNGEYDMFDDVHIQKLSEICDNSNFAQWYEDVDGVNFRINKTLDVPSVGRNLYQINYNYNNGGFSPLDSVDAYGNYFGASACYPIIQRKGKGEDNTPINTSCNQWGPQSLTIYCPPYAYPYASSQTDATGANTATLCTSWLANGGPKNPTAAVAAFNSNTTLGYKHLRNYSYTMMGYVKFKYQSANQENGGEVFEFVADDDMWVFVDGVLAEDRGGVHSTAPAPGAVNIKTLAMNNHGCHVGEPLAGYTNCIGASDETGWGENSWHHLHFFYAERQNNGASNLLIRSTFAEVAPPKFGWPSITDGCWARIENGQSIIRVTVNIGLSPETLEALAWQAAANENVKVGDRVNPATTKYAVLVKRAILDNNGQPRDYVIYGLLLTGVSEIPVSGGEVEYEFRGVLVDENGNVVGNIQRADGIAFNYTASAGAENMVYEYWNTHAIDVISSSGKRVEYFRSEWPRMIVLVQPDGSSSSSQNYSSSSYQEHGSSSSQKPSSSSSQEYGSSSSQKFGISSSQEYDSSSSVESTSSSSRHHSDDDEELDGNEDDGKTFVVGTPELSGGLSVVLQGNTLQVGTAKAGLLKIQVFDMVGHVIESVSENVPAGNFAYTFGKMGKGAYIVRVQQGAIVRTIRK